MSWTNQLWRAIQFYSLQKNPFLAQQSVSSVLEENVKLFTNYKQCEISSKSRQTTPTVKVVAASFGSGAKYEVDFVTVYSAKYIASNMDYMC